MKTSVKYTHFNPFFLPFWRGKKLTHGFGVNDAMEMLSDKMTLQRFHHWIRNYELIIISDVTMDAIPFLLLQDYAKLFDCRILVQITNRFDMFAHYRGNLPSYLALINSTSNSSHIFYVANNPWDQKYIALSNLTLNVTLIRPFGEAPVVTSSKEMSSTDSNKCAYLSSHRFNLSAHQIPFNESNLLLLPSLYGGPATLANYKCVVFIPYQVSVMKMIENMLSGVLTFIPSPRFMVELCSKYAPFLKDIEGVILWQTKQNNLNWEKYVEFYAPEFRDWFYTFDSWEEMNALIALSREDIDPRNIRSTMKTFAKSHVLHNYEVMRDYLHFTLRLTSSHV